MPERMYFDRAAKRERLKLASSRKYEVKERVELYWCTCPQGNWRRFRLITCRSDMKCMKTSALL